VYGRKAGSLSSFGYSDALRQSQLVSDDRTLDEWLTDPEKRVPGSDMAFRVPSGDERAAIIAYLKQISGLSN
jgi:cytochrome c